MGNKKLAPQLKNLKELKKIYQRNSLRVIKKGGAHGVIESLSTSRGEKTCGKKGKYVFTIPSREGQIARSQVNTLKNKGDGQATYQSNRRRISFH